MTTERHVLVLGAGQIGLATAEVLHERAGHRFSLHCRGRDGLARAAARAAAMGLSLVATSSGDLAAPDDGSTVAQLIADLRPDAVVDATNMATMLSRQPDQQAAAHRLARYSTELVRAAALVGAPVVKVSTTALGGMGLDIPFTHGDPTARLLSPGMWAKLFLSGIQLQVLWTMARTYPSLGVHVVIPAACVGFGEPEAVTVVEAVTAGNRGSARTLARDGQPLAPTVSARAGEGPDYTRRELAVLAGPGVMGALTAREVGATVAGILQGSGEGDALAALAASCLRPSPAGQVALADTLAALHAAEQDLRTDPYVTGNLGAHATRLLLELACFEAVLGGQWAHEVRTGEPARLAQRVADGLPGQGRLLAEVVDRGLGLVDAHGTWYVEGAAGAGAVEVDAASVARWGGLLRRYAPAVHGAGHDVLARLLSVPAAREELRHRGARQEESA